MKSIVLLTGTRADYSPLKHVLIKMSQDSEIKITLLVTGTHLSNQFGYTLKEIENDGFGKFVVKIPIPTEDDSKFGMAYSTGIAVNKFAEYFKENRPDMLVVLGDRFEAMAVSISAYLMNIPIAHISGGDVTEGAVDDAIRHCITKMSNLHFPGCEESAKRIIQMGESPDRVFNVGDTSVESCLSTNLLSKEELSKIFPVKIMADNYAIVTFHSVTIEDGTEQEQVYNLIKAMDKIVGLFYLITLSNADAGGRTINNIWLEEKQKHNNWFVTPSLGVTKYLSALKYSKAVIGNSSSGIYEAPVFGIPTVNIGDRQKGRMKAESIIDCKPIERDIKESIELALSDKYQKMAKNIKSPFGDGTASTQIVKHIKEYLDNPFRDLKKRFYDINFEVNK